MQGQLCLSVTQLSWDEVMGLIILQTLCIASSQLSADLQTAFPKHNTALEAFLYFRLVSRTFLPPLKLCLHYK